VNIRGVNSSLVVDRRVKGILLLAVVLLAAVVLPNLSAQRLAGVPILGTVPAPPHVGQCLLQSPASGSRRGSGGTYHLGRCTTTHYGEVAEVVSGATINARSTGDLAPVNACGDQNAYLGWSSPVTATAQVQWRPIDLTVMSMNPTPVQRAFGQRWVVCVVSPATAGASYTGSVRGALATGRLPSSFAHCLSSATTTDSAVPCDEPHPVEIFGTAEISTTFRDQAALDADCQVIAKSVIRRSDPTAGGALTIKATPFHWDSTGDPETGFSDLRGDLGAGAVCTARVSGVRLLDDTLFGLGSRPLPWA
jgi:hypothetical protein